MHMVNEEMKYNILYCELYCIIKTVKSLQIFYQKFKQTYIKKNCAASKNCGTP